MQSCERPVNIFSTKCLSIIFTLLSAKMSSVFKLVFSKEGSTGHQEDVKWMEGILWRKRRKLTNTGLDEVKQVSLIL